MYFVVSWVSYVFCQHAQFQSQLNVFSGAGVLNSNNLTTSSCTRAMYFIISTIFCLNLMMEIVKRVLVSVFSLVLKSWIRQVLQLWLRSRDYFWTVCTSMKILFKLNDSLLQCHISLNKTQFGILSLLFRLSYLALEGQILTLSLYINQT